jgi:DNA-binding SARP family transcriptional activator/tetratricopeptide (TPR) repeat protein
VVEFRVLGPLEVIGAAGPISISGERPRAIVALLALNANTPVTTERLVEAVWREDPPATVDHALRVHISGLRRKLPENTIETVGSGYRLNAGPGEVDLAEFESLAAQAARAIGNGEAGASGLARSALSLWRGTPFPELAGGSAATAERVRLEEMRSVVQELFVDAQITDGRDADLIPELRRLVAESPLREGYQRRLMLALYRSGRQGEALEVYRQARYLLNDELGIEPGPELESMQRAILVQDPALLAQFRASRNAPDRSLPANDAATEDFSRASAHVGTRVRGTVVGLVIELSPDMGVLPAEDPEAFDQARTQATHAANQIIVGYGGSIRPGLGITALFGDATSHDDDGLRAVTAAARIRAEFERGDRTRSRPGGRRLVVRCGIAVGEAVLDRTQAESPIVAGDVLGAASRLALAAEPNEILLSVSLLRLLRSAVVSAPGPSPGAVRLLRLAKPMGEQASRSSPLFGRQRELALLHGALDQTLVDQSCRLVSLLGPAGIGKSRLVHEFLSEIRPTVTVARGRCLPYGESVALSALADVVREAVDAKPDDGRAEIRSRLAARLNGEPRAAAIADLVATAIGISEAAGSATETFWAVRRFFEHLAIDRPVALVFDDVQWADSVFLDLLDYVAETARAVPILLLCIARPELLDARPGWGGGKLDATSILLGGLPDSDVAQVVASALDAAPADDLVARVVAAADGNPLFAEEWLAMLVDDRLVKIVQGKWELDGSIESLPTPPSIKAVLTARIDRLPASDRRLIERAAVVGKVFTGEAVRSIMEPDLVEDVDRALAALVRRDLIRPDRSASALADTYRFKHILIRDAAYEAIPKLARADLHEAVAHYYERADLDWGSLHDEWVGSHLEQAYRYRSELGLADPKTLDLARRAAESLGAAGTRAAIRGDSGLAVGLLRRAVDLLPASAGHRLDLLAQLALALSDHGELVLAEERLAELEQLTTGPTLEGAHWRALLGRELVREVRAAPSLAARELTHRAVTYFESAQDPRGLVFAIGREANLDVLEGHFGAARETLKRGVLVARRSRDFYGEARARTETCACEVLGMTPVAEALSDAESLLAWSREHGLVGTEAVAMSQVGRLIAMQGRIDEGRDFVNAGIAVLRDLGRGLMVSSSAQWLATVEMLAGDTDALERALRLGYEETKRQGSRRVLSTFALDLCRVVLDKGDLQEAAELATTAREIVPTWMPAWRNWSASVQAAVMFRQGEEAAAIDQSLAALGGMQASDHLFVRTSALVAHAELLEMSGRPEAAAPFIDDALGLWEQKGVAQMVERIRHRTTRTTPPPNPALAG